MSYICPACDKRRKDSDGCADADGEICDSCWNIVNKALPLRRPVATPMLLTCPMCRKRHVDKGEWATKLHKDHACEHCGMCWRPAMVFTVGVRFLPGCEPKP